LSLRFDRVRFQALGAYSLDFEVVYFVTDPDYGLCVDEQQRLNLPSCAARGAPNRVRLSRRTVSLVEAAGATEAPETAATAPRPPTSQRPAPRTGQSIPAAA